MKYLTIQTEWSVKLFLIIALCALNNLYAQGIVHYESKLKSKVQNDQIEAIQGLGGLQSKEALYIIARSLPNLNIIVREKCMHVLAAWEGEEKDNAMKLLFKHVVSDKAHTVRAEAGLALGAMAKRSAATGDEDRVKKIVKLLKVRIRKDVAEVRMKILTGLSNIGDISFIDVAIEGLRDNKKKVRHQAVLGFEKMNAAEHVDILYKHFWKDRYIITREPIIKITHKLDKEKSFKFLAKILLTPTSKQMEPPMRRLAAELLATYSDTEHSLEAVGYLARAYKGEKDQQLRLTILNAATKFDRSLPPVQLIFQRASKDIKKIRERLQEILDFNK